MEYLRTMVRVTNLDASLKFFCRLLGPVEVRRREHEKSRFTLVFLAAPGRRGYGKRDPKANNRTDLQLGSRRLSRWSEFRPSGLPRR